MLLLKREQDNTEDKFVIAVVKSGAVVEHVLKKLAPVVSQFLKRDCNKRVVRITGKQITGEVAMVSKPTASSVCMAQSLTSDV